LQHRDDGDDHVEDEEAPGRCFHGGRCCGTIGLLSRPSRGDGKKKGPPAREAATDTDVTVFGMLLVRLAIYLLSIGLLIATQQAFRKK
jgi:hypothetical protein